VGWALLVQTAHWFTDVVGGVLVAVVALALAVRLPFTRGRGSAPAADD
jgi:membrane-associated phospholipid phosphatase